MTCHVHPLPALDVMPFTDLDKHFIKSLHRLKEKHYSYLNLFVNFRTKTGIAVV